MSVDVRRAGPADSRGIVALNRRIAADAPYFLAYDIDPATGADMLQAKLERGLGGVFVGANGVEIVGLAVLRPHVHPAFKGVLQVGLGVDPAWRRQGIARRLLASVESAAKAEGARRIQAAIVDGNGASFALFEQAGYVAEGRLRGALEIEGERRDMIPLALTLA